MLTCNCTLPYTNPDVCKSCSVYLSELTRNEIVDDDFYRDFLKFDKEKYVKNSSPSKIIKRTIERYDENNKYLGKEVITEEITENLHPTF